MFRIIFDKTKGTFTSFTYRGVETVINGPVPNLWRAPTNNDEGGEQLSYTFRWNLHNYRRARLTNTQTSYEYTPEGKVLVTVAALLSTRPDSNYQATFLIDESGTIEIDSSMKLNGGPTLPALPRFGLQMELVNSFKNIKWYGRGPHEK